MKRTSLWIRFPVSPFYGACVKYATRFAVQFVKILQIMGFRMDAPRQYSVCTCISDNLNSRKIVCLHSLLWSRSAKAEFHRTLDISRFAAGLCLPLLVPGVEIPLPRKPEWRLPHPSASAWDRRSRMNSRARAAPSCGEQTAWRAWNELFPHAVFLRLRQPVYRDTVWHRFP